MTQISAPVDSVLSRRRKPEAAAGMAAVLSGGGNAHGGGVVVVGAGDSWRERRANAEFLVTDSRFEFAEQIYWLSRIYVKRREVENDEMVQAISPRLGEGQ